VLRGQLYVVGGVCGPMALSHVERFDINIKKWISVSPLSETRR
jgi:Kelch motif